MAFWSARNGARFPLSPSASAARQVRLAPRTATPFLPRRGGPARHGTASVPPTPGIQRSEANVTASREARTLPKLTSDWASARHTGAGWPRFLEAVHLDGIRGWSAQWVEFRFPVVAIAGENGSGKSTVLKVAAAAYRQAESASAVTSRTFSPDDFFPSTPWESVAGVNLGYRVRQGDQVSTYSVRKLTSRWRGMPERPTRSVYFLDISRTQPIDTLIGYGRLARAELAESAHEVHIDDNFLPMLSRVLGRTYDSGSLVRDDRGKQVGVVVAAGTTYSNFHQGAGEDATTDLVALLQEAPRHSLVLIDEVEASLHPRAQRRLMTELIQVATDRRLQLVATTHSPYVLEQLPAEARIYLQGDREGLKEVIYGATPEYALSLMDDERHPELTLYCEDVQSLYIIERILGTRSPGLLSRVQVVHVGPAGTVRTLGGLIASGRLPGRAVAVLDADQAPAPGCLVLPGTASPEREAFASMTDDTWAKVAERLAVRLGDLLDAVEDAVRLDDPHTWSSRVAERLHASMRPSRVWESVADVWIQYVLSDAEKDRFLAGVSSLIPATSVAGSQAGGVEQLSL